MGHGAVAGLTWLCYMITQPVGCPPVKCLLALMNGCNMPRITTRHATHSLMASRNGRDVPPMLRQESRGGGGSCSERVRNGVHEYSNLVSVLPFKAVNKRNMVSSFE